MMTLFNARERELEDWKDLFRQADKRFKFISARLPEVGTMSVITAIWDDIGNQASGKAKAYKD
jgi:hypothetical protein